LTAEWNRAADNGRQMAKASHEELLEEFRGKILPPNHPLTRAVSDIVTRILEASNLGSLKAEPSFIQQIGTSIEDLWHADVQNREEPVPGSGGREWRLMVVDDPKVVNAMASFGQRLAIHLTGEFTQID
jgi:hypothetical protein